MKPWHSDPALRGRFHPDAVDDCQIVVHAGGPRLSSVAPELVWVTVFDRDRSTYFGRLLNRPTGLTNLDVGSVVRFVAAEHAPYPVMVTDEYLSERPCWSVHACDKCGLSELFDPPSRLMRVAFPDLPVDAEVEMFTSFCPLCGGVMGLERVDTQDTHAAAPADRRPWWKFWGS